MAIELDHTMVPAFDKVASAHFIARIFGLHYDGEGPYLATVQANNRSNMYLDNDDDFHVHHYAFTVSEAEFDQMLGRIQEEGLSHGRGSGSPRDMKIKHRGGGREVYFLDSKGHILDILSVE